VEATTQGAPVAVEPGDTMQARPSAEQPGAGSPRVLPGQPQPLLLATAVALVVPYLLAVAAPWPVLLVAVLLVSWGLSIAWQRRRGDLDPYRTAWLGQLESIGGAAAYLLLLVVDGGRNPTATLLLAAGVVATVAILDPPVLRLTIQAVTVLAAGMAVGLGRSWLDGAFVAALLAVVAVLSNAYAAERQAAADRQDRARRDVDRRTQLLATIEELPDDDADEAARAVVAALRELAYDGAAVELIRGDHLGLVAIDGMQALPHPRRGQGIGWQAIEERRTVTTDRYQRSARRLDGREGVHAGVATPIMAEGQPFGCLVGLRVAAEPPSEAEVEIAEVLALHLGGVLARLDRERWQRVQLDQLERLRHLHAELAVALGAELRGPLTEFRELGAAVAEADADDQRELVERFSRRTEDVFRTVETVLEVGRSQAASGLPIARAVDVGELLDPVTRATGAALTSRLDELPGGGAVMVVAPLVQRGLELLLLSGSPPAHPTSPTSAPSPTKGDVEAPGRGAGRLTVGVAPDHLVVTVVRDTGAPTGVARSVATRLLRSAGADLDAEQELVVKLPLACAPDDAEAVRAEVLGCT
jgi:membrane protein implicated in regulation of membrane protease activity